MAAQVKICLWLASPCTPCLSSQKSPLKSQLLFVCWVRYSPMAMAKEQDKYRVGHYLQLGQWRLMSAASILYLGIIMLFHLAESCTVYEAFMYLYASLTLNNGVSLQKTIQKDFFLTNQPLQHIDNKYF